MCFETMPGMKSIVWGVLTALLLFLAVGVRHFVPTDVGTTRLERSGKSEVLVVAMRGLAGGGSVTALEGFLRRTFPDAELLFSTYEPSPFANIDPYRLANTIEHAIHDAYTARRYKRIVLVGYSMGAMILRKALVWGHGIEEDRHHLGAQGKREWVDRVERFVSLASVNRGWTMDPKPDNMGAATYVSYLVAEKFARLTRTGKLILGMQQGSPFIADLRVQWIRLARDPAVQTGGRKLPLVVHLLGDIDDIVSRADSQDIGVAKDTRFITLKNTDHLNIVNALSESRPRTPEAADRIKKIRDALLLEEKDLPLDRTALQAEDLSVTRVIYIVHGIRDYGKWGEEIRKKIEESAPLHQSGVAVVPPKYGYFPMMPFLLYWDRQKNVRKFMDEYTENLARFPRATRFDFVGHSNGTYILASALQHYKTLRVGNVFFAGSVVPKHYPWQPLADEGRVAKVRNVVANGDWVVALFPRFFEQVAEWLGTRPVDGILDIGSAGFRGFEDASDAHGRIRDLKFVDGAHGAGIDVGNQAKLSAIVRYALHGDDARLDVFKETGSEGKLLDLLSNVSWVVWLVLAAVLVYAARLAGRYGWKGLLTYGVFVLGILYSF